MNKSLQLKILENPNKYKFLENIIKNKCSYSKVPVPDHVKTPKPHQPLTYDITTFVCEKWSILKNTEKIEETKTARLERQNNEKQNYHEAYLQFLKAVNWSDSLTTLRSFDISVFCDVLNNDYTDLQIQTFLKKLVHDPISYEKNQNLIFFEILKFAYIYSCMVGLKPIQLSIKKRLYENTIHNRAFKSCFRYVIVNDPTIDTFVMKSCTLEKSYDESILLNSFYKIHINKQHSNKKMIDLFFVRFIATIKTIDPGYLVDFIRNVFLHNTVLCRLVSTSEIFEIPISILEKLTFQEKYIASIFNFYHGIITKEGLCAELYRLSLEILHKFSKHFKDFYKVELYVQNSMSGFETIVMKNPDSYSIVSQSVTNFCGVIETNIGNIKTESLLKSIILILKVVNAIKHEFVMQLTDKILHFLFQLLFYTEKLLNNKESVSESDKVTVINWITQEQNFLLNSLSSFTLLVYCNDDKSLVSKKKKGCHVKNRKNSALLKLVAKIRQIEHVINSNRKRYNIVTEIVLLKNKSFEIKC